MQNWVYDYMHDTIPFYQWSLSHFMALGVSLFAIIFIPWYSKKYLTVKQQHIVGSTIGITITVSLLMWNLLNYLSGTYSLQEDLPLQLCRFSNLTIFLVMVWKKQWWFEILYFWSLGGMLQASITPDLQENFPHFLYIRYWIGHTGMILAIVYACVVYGMRPRAKDIWKAMIGINVFLVIAAIVNYLLDANYFWICGKPPSASILDYFGPWPYYVFFAEFVALANFVAAYIPWWIIDAINKKELAIKNNE
jgi:hypothetical integral membrane protein (TIGR02206 family)